MIYLWGIPDDFYGTEIGDPSDKYVGHYDQANGPDEVIFWRGKLIPPQDKELIFKFEATKEELKIYDVLINTSFIIINERVKSIFEKSASEDVQYFTPKIICKDGLLEGYHVVNILHCVSGIDKEKSIIEYMKTLPNDILGFDLLAYHHDCLGMHHIAREEEYHPFILVSQELKNALCSLQPKIKGVQFNLPENREF